MIAHQISLAHVRLKDQDSVNDTTHEGLEVNTAELIEALIDPSLYLGVISAFSWLTYQYLSLTC